MSLTLPLPFPISESVITETIRAALDEWASGSIEERGAIYTRREVVDFILDLIGYTSDQPLHRQHLLEPCFGGGDFLLPVLERLLIAYSEDKHKDSSFDALRNSLRAVELHRATFLSTRNKLDKALEAAAFNENERDILLGSWLINGDFLLEPLDSGFSFVIGNPPYVRQERIPDALLQEYRRRYTTLFDRADLYIPFLEKSLSLLGEGGSVGFICSDRWMKNRYGGPLRRMVSRDYSLKFYVDMVNTDAFHSEVIAYPAITVITRQKANVTRLAHRPEIEAESLASLAREMTSGASSVREMTGVVQGDSPWVLDSFDQLDIVRRLEGEFPCLEEAGCRVGIGVATGADKVFIAPFEKLDVEEDRKLPLAMTRDLPGNCVMWRGYGVINPFREDGSLVPLQDYPRLAAYLEEHSAAVKARYVSKRNPDGWYRTIDRITPSLAQTPKLLIPDIKGEAHIVYDDGQFYPHHNLYFITSEEWDLKALRALLMSGIARLFVATYSTKMHGGFLRFQAQYLRRIRVPRWQSIPPALRNTLIQATESGDIAACNAAAFAVYGFSKNEQRILSGNGNGD